MFPLILTGYSRLTVLNRTFYCNPDEGLLVLGGRSQVEGVNRVPPDEVFRRFANMLGQAKSYTCEVSGSEPPTLKPKP